MATILIVSLAIVLGLGASPKHNQNVKTSLTFAILPLVAGDTGLPYAVLPTPSERLALGRRLGMQMVVPGHLEEANVLRVQRAVAGAGFDQNSTIRFCNDAGCARAIGRRLGVRTVVFGSVTRYLALIWGASVTTVDVATGATRGPYSIGYKGDYLSLSMGIAPLADSLSTSLRGRQQPVQRRNDQ